MTPDQMLTIARETILLEPRIKSIWWSPTIVIHSDGKVDTSIVLAVCTEGASMGCSPEPGESITPEWILSRIDRRLNPEKHQPRLTKPASPIKNLSLDDIGL